uniref:RING-type domain-containing protein n=1 Tax=viral metagenome TaxID=1070528 RepID=A0A6C0K2H6_9ZZZZ
MSEIIDLTNDDMHQVIAQPTRRPRAPPKCGYCAMPGHTVRSCNDPGVMNTLRQLLQMINRFPPYETIIHWLHTHDVNVLQLIVSKYTYTAYRKHSKQICIDILSVAIADKYRMEERRNMETVQDNLRRGSILLWTRSEDPVNIPLLYRQYCSQFMYTETTPPPTEEECQLLCNIIQTRVLNPNIPYHTVKRFHRFLLYRHLEYMSDPENRIDNNTSNDNVIKYVITRKTIAIPIEIDCSICMETVKTPDILTTTCGHQFCRDCITSFVNKTRTQRCGCPLCRAPIYKLIREVV